MRKIQSQFESLIKHAKFKSNFKLCLYLNQFTSISMVKQGFYFLSLALCPESILSKKFGSAASQKNWVKTYSSSVFHIKYNNHTERLSELAIFTFDFQEGLPFDCAPGKHKLLLVFQLMKSNNDAMEEPEHKVLDQYHAVAEFEFELNLHSQLSFIEYLDVKFQPPYAAELSGVAIGLMTGFQACEAGPIIETEGRVLHSHKMEKVQGYFAMMGALRKLSKKHRFNSYIVQKGIEDTFLGFKSVISIPSPTKSVQEETSLFTEDNSEEGCFFELEPGLVKKPHSLMCMSAGQHILEQSRYEANEVQMHGNHNKSLFASISIQSNLSGNVEAKLSKVNQKQCSQQQFMKYLAFAEYQDNRIHEVLDQINNLGNRNWQVVQELISCLNMQTDKSDILFKVQIAELKQEYLRKRNLLYGQKTTNIGQSLVSAASQMEKYKKMIEGLKGKKQAKYFTKMTQLTNLIPSRESNTDSLNYDCCPFVLCSSEEYFEGALRQDEFEDFEQHSNEQQGSVSKQSKASSVSTENEESQFKNVFILAHGYQATSSNMERLKISLKKIFPRGKFLVLKSFSQQMDRGLEEMGVKAGKQIEAFYSQVSESTSKKLRLILVGHSMGGIILRASFQHLSPKIRASFHTFISFATPHLGYLNCKSLVTGAGIKLIESMHPSTSLKQLSNKDKNNIKQTYIYKLASVGSLREFRNIILFSSMEDKYVPWNSARLQLYKEPQGVGGKSTTGGWSINSEKHYFRFIQKEMIAQLLGLGQKQLSRVRNVYRFEVDFNISHVNLDTMIGRTAHVAFLGNEHLLNMALENCLRKDIHAELKNQ